MFASLKNKIKEETGTDPATAAVQQQRLHNNNNRIRSRFSSTLSVNSNQDDMLSAAGQSHSESEYLSSLRSQCNELSTKVTELQARLQTLHEEKTRIERTNEILLESVRVAQTQKDLYCEEQEKIQNLQQAEIEKLKSLLSFREQEAMDRAAMVKQSQQQIENLTAELERLKKYEPMVDDLQDSLETENRELKKRVDDAEERFNEYSANTEAATNALRQQNVQIQKQLQEVQSDLEHEREENVTALLKNAEISQREEMLKKELRIERDESVEVHEKLNKLEEDLKQQQQILEDNQKQLASKEDELNKNNEQLKELEDLRNELDEKNKAIKVLNQRLADLKKTVQREFRNAKDLTATGDSTHLPENGLKLVPSSTDKAGEQLSIPAGHIVMDEVNFKYLKHVLLKFLTSREVEARHLIRAVATLLKMSKEEEKLLHDTLNWKMSWFGTKPDHGRGQTAVAIPPS